MLLGKGSRPRVLRIKVRSCRNKCLRFRNRGLGFRRGKGDLGV